MGDDTEKETTSASEWLRRFAGRLGPAAPSPEEVDDLLALAGIAAHASERTAAPLSAWLVGKAGVPPAAAKEMAQQLAAELAAALPGGT